MHLPINVKSPNNISKWQMGFNSAFKGLMTVLWPRRLVAGLSLWRPGFDRTSFPVRFNVALGQALLRVFRFTLVTIIPPMLHTHLHLHAALSEVGENWLEKYFCLFYTVQFVHSFFCLSYDRSTAPSKAISPQMRSSDSCCSFRYPFFSLR
jgi:hypothetical protein